MISQVSVNNKGMAIQNYVHPVKSALSSMEIKPVIKLQPPVILPSNDIDNLRQASWYFWRALTTDPIAQATCKTILKGDTQAS